MEEVITINEKDIEIIDLEEYLERQQKNNNSEMKEIIFDGANHKIDNIKDMLLNVPKIAEAVKEMMPNTEYRAVLTPEQRRQLAKGLIRFLKKKDGKILATVVNSKNSKFKNQISLEKIVDFPEIEKAASDLATQLQMAEIAEKIDQIQKTVEMIQTGQENDRLALAYSCQQKLVQAMALEDPSLKKYALLNIAHDAENSRNMLMKSSAEYIEFIKKQPEGVINKLIHGDSVEKTDDAMKKIRDGLCTINMVSLVESIAYQGNGEMKAAKKSLGYYSKYLEETYIEDKLLLNTLDGMDYQADNYWNKSIPFINKKIKKLEAGDVKLIGGNENEKMQSM